MILIWIVDVLKNAVLFEVPVPEVYPAVAQLGVLGEEGVQASMDRKQIDGALKDVARSR